MTFGDAMWFAYQAFATLVFSCQVIYFATRGAREHLKERKIGADLAKQDEEIRDILRKNERV